MKKWSIIYAFSLVIESYRKYSDITNMYKKLKIFNKKIILGILYKTLIQNNLITKLSFIKLRITEED